VLQFPRGADPTTFDPPTTRIVADHRSATVLERFVDPADPRLPDHAATPSAPPVDHFSQFRILSSSKLGIR
jgi:hypothetical protein